MNDWSDKQELWVLTFNFEAQNRMSRKYFGAVHALKIPWRLGDQTFEMMENLTGRLEKLLCCSAFTLGFPKQVQITRNQ